MSLTSSTEKPRRHRGARPGKTSVSKQGFYSRPYTAIELGDLEKLLNADGLNDEIDLIRVQIRRLQYIANGEEDLDKLMSILNTLGAASTRLAGLLRTNQALDKRQTDTISLLAQAIEEVFGSGLDPRKP